METNEAQRLVQHLSDPIILAAELDLTRRRVTALLGELGIHLDIENDLQEAAVRQRAAYIRNLEDFERQRETERWVFHKAYIVNLLFGCSGWVAFFGLLFYALAFGI